MIQLRLNRGGAAFHDDHPVAQIVKSDFNATDASFKFERFLDVWCRVAMAG
jgi:hypothetical protein